MDTLRATDISLGERAYRQLKEAIVRCKYPPGERLRVEELSQRLEISSSPVREALSRLAKQELVRALDKRGFRVAPLDREGIAEITRIRLLLECEASRESIAQGNDEWEARIVASAHSLSLIEQRPGDEPVALDNEWSERHRAFHLAIYSGCQSRLLLGMVSDLFDRAERYRRHSARHRGRERGKHDEHEQILRAVLAREANAAVRLLTRHIKATKATVSRAMVGD